MKKGISLIVLVITIIVMVILVGAVVMTLENTGITKQSKKATNKTNYAQEITRLEVIKNGILTDNLGKITVAEYITELTNKGIIEGTVTDNSDGSKTFTTDTGAEVTVTQNGARDLLIEIAGFTQNNNSGVNNGNNVSGGDNTGNDSSTEPKEYATVTIHNWGHESVVRAYIDGVQYSEPNGIETLTLAVGTEIRFEVLASAYNIVDAPGTIDIYVGNEYVNILTTTSSTVASEFTYTIVGDVEIDIDLNMDIDGDYEGGAVRIHSNEKHIKFTVGNTVYAAIEGMTWKEWVNSSYCVGSEFKIDYFNGIEYPYYGAYSDPEDAVYTNRIYISNEPQRGSMAIISNQVYSIGEDD